MRILEPCDTVGNHGRPGGFTSTSNLSCGPYQISSSFSDTSTMSSPPVTQPSSWRRLVAGNEPPAWIRPLTKSLSSAQRGSTCPALPAATVTHLPRVANALSIQRAIVLEVSWACPFVPRLMLIDTGSGVRSSFRSAPSRAARSSR